MWAPSLAVIVGIASPAGTTRRHMIGGLKRCAERSRHGIDTWSKIRAWSDRRVSAAPDSSRLSVALYSEKLDQNSTALNPGCREQASPPEPEMLTACGW